MKVPDIRYVDPRELRPRSRFSTVDPYKYHRQVAQFGSSASGMPPLVVYEAADGILVVYDGLTRATRIARLSPGTTVPVNVVGKLQRKYAAVPTIGDLIP